MKLEVKGFMVVCPRTGQQVSVKCCEHVVNGKVKNQCDHFGYWETDRKIACRYSKERELRLSGEFHMI